MHEALGLFERQGRRLDALRIRAFPFSSEVDDFLASHDRIFVVEQNRDAQLRTLLMAENGGDPDRLISPVRCVKRPQATAWPNPSLPARSTPQGVQCSSDADRLRPVHRCGRGCARR